MDISPEAPAPKADADLDLDLDVEVDLGSVPEVEPVIGQLHPGYEPL